MSQRKVDDFISNTFNGIIKESREYKAYELGVAYGSLYCYKYGLMDLGKEKIDMAFKNYFEGTDNMSVYFQELVKLSKEENSKADDFIDTYRNHRLRAEDKQLNDKIALIVRKEIANIFKETVK